MIKKYINIVLITLVSFIFAGCNVLPVAKTGPTEYGVRFRALPPVLGGGVSHKVIKPGQMVFLMPWERVYVFDTSLQYISWGKGKNSAESDYIYTRAKDGNEVALAVTIQYRISNNAEDILKLIQTVARNNNKVQEIVTAIARADIRTYMNELKTSEFFDRNARYAAIDRAKEAMKRRLSKYGIIVEKLILDEHRFERLLSNGTIDRSYQEKIDETQKLGQDTERELLRIATVEAKKKQEFNETQAKVNRLIEEAIGVKQQLIKKADAYLAVKQNEAEGIKRRGELEAKAIKEQVNALKGKGGRKIIKRELAKRLSQLEPKFIALDIDDTESLGVNKIDINALVQSLGILEGVKQNERKDEYINTNKNKK